MTGELERIDRAVAELTAAGQPFALNTLEINGIAYRNYAAMPTDLGEYSRAMLRHADKDFLVYRDERYSFGECYQRSAELANALIHTFGIKPGDRVAILSRNNPQWIMSFIAIVSVGAVAVPMNAWWTSEELDYGLGDSGARLAIADRTRIERLLPLVARRELAVISIDECGDMALDHQPFADVCATFAGSSMPAVPFGTDDPATIMYTSGSTGHPKGALSSHRGILSALYSWFLLGHATNKAVPQSASGKRWPAAGLLTVPLFHCTGSHSAFLMSLPIGRKLVLMHKWDPQEALRLIETERVTWFNGVPTMSAELQAAAAESSRDLSSLADIMAGGAARPPDQVAKISGAFRKATPGIGYGLTETNALGAVNVGNAYRDRPSSTGRVVPAVTEFRIVDDHGQPLPTGQRGEVCIKSPANVLGYWNKPEATREAFVDGWFHTGDVGYLDEDGFVYIVDRIKEIVIRGGENISTVEVEAALFAHPGIAEAAVFGLPDRRLGEVVGAVVVLRPGEQLEADALRDYLGRHLAGFKIPVHIWFREGQLPRIASGKIFKRQLKAEYTEALTGTR